MKSTGPQLPCRGDQHVRGSFRDPGGLDHKGSCFICLTSHMNAATIAPFRIAAEPAPLDLVAKYFRAFGDPTRLRLIAALDDQEASVGQLVEELRLPQPQVSKHLACLRWCGFVETRREHRTVYYRVADERVAELLALGRALLADNADHVAACSAVDGPC